MKRLRSSTCLIARSSLTRKIIKIIKNRCPQSPSRVLVDDSIKFGPLKKMSDVAETLARSAAFKAL